MTVYIAVPVVLGSLTLLGIFGAITSSAPKKHRNSSKQTVKGIIETFNIYAFSIFFLISSHAKADRDENCYVVW